MPGDGRVATIELTTDGAERMDVEPKLTTRFEVVAYDEGGYGDNRTRDFSSEDEAVEYARSLEARFHPRVWKRITMQPISIHIPH